MGELMKLINIGKVLEKNLNEAGIHTEEQLREIGSKEAFIRIRERRIPGLPERALQPAGSNRRRHRLFFARKHKE